MIYKPVLTKEELEKLASEQKEQTAEIFTPNDFYGHAAIIKQYCGLEQTYRLPGIIPHGPNPREKVWDHEINHPIPFFLLYSKQQQEKYARHSNKQSFIIGSPIYYARHIIREELSKILEKAQGTIVFPSHSTHHITVEYCQSGFIEFLKSLPRNNHPITICLYWRDIQLRRHIDYINAGFNCTTAGHMYDKQFIFRLLRLMASHKYAIINTYGSSSIYCASLSIPVYLFEQSIEKKAARENQPSHLIKEVCSPDQLLPIIKTFFDICKSTHSEHILQQNEIAKNLLGYDSILKPKEMRDLFEQLWQTEEMKPFRKQNQVKYTLEGTLNNIIRHLNNNITSYPRRTPGKLKIEGKTLYYADLHSFYHQVLQIFGSNLYQFDTNKERPVILDCGAHIGLASLYFATRYPNARIYAYEADAAIAKMLANNVKEFGLKQVTVHPQAIWIHTDGIYFNDSGDDSGYIDEKQETKPKTPSFRLRDFLSDNYVDLLKLDIEGAEYEVIKDCDGVLSNVSNIIMEVHKFTKDNGSLGNLLSILKRNRFDYTLGDLHPATWLESSAKPPFSACKTDKYIITIFAWLKKIPKQEKENGKSHKTSSNADLLLKASKLLNINSNSEALETLTQIVREGAANNDIYYAIAVAHARMKNYDDALLALSKLSQKDKLYAQAQTLLKSIYSKKQNTVYLVSYPRSGNTWMRILIADIILQSLGYKTYTSLPISLAAIIPDLHLSNETNMYFDSPINLIKTHDPFRNEFRKLLFIFREPTDSLVSYYHYHLRYPHLKDSVKDGIDNFCLRMLEKWRNHLESYINAKKKNYQNILFVSYENMHRNTVDALSRVLHFINFPFTHSMVEASVKNHLFGKHYEQEIINKNQLGKFFRKGIIGSGRKEISLKTFKIIAEQAMPAYSQAKEIEKQQMYEENK